MNREAFGPPHANTQVNIPMYVCSESIYGSTSIIQGSLNRGAICVCMHLRSSADEKEPGCQAKAIEIIGAGMHKRPEDGMWLLAGWQTGNSIIICVSF